MKGRVPELWDGRSAERIVEILIKDLTLNLAYPACPMESSFGCYSIGVKFFVEKERSEFNRGTLNLIVWVGRAAERIVDILVNKNKLIHYSSFDPIY